MSRTLECPGPRYAKDLVMSRALLCPGIRYAHGLVMPWALIVPWSCYVQGLAMFRQKLAVTELTDHSQCGQTVQPVVILANINCTFS